MSNGGWYGFFTVIGTLNCDPLLGGFVGFQKEEAKLIKYIKNRKYKSATMKLVKKNIV